MLTTNTDKLRAVVADHIARDAVIQSDYWDEDAHRGCFIGCLARGNKPELNEQQYGLPVMLQRIAENIFEGLPADEAKAFFAALPDAVGCDGKDLTRVGWQFLAAELRALPQQEADIQAVIDPVIAGMDRLAAGQEWQGDDAALAVAAADAARPATWAAGDATWAARAAALAVAAADDAAAAAQAATAVVWATRAAADAATRAARTAADAVWATRTAAWAAAARATRAARAAARRGQRDLLLRLIAEAPIIEEKEIG